VIPLRFHPNIPFFQYSILPIFHHSDEIESRLPMARLPEGSRL